MWQPCCEPVKGQLPEAQHWPTLYREGAMAELLDLTRYLPAEPQPHLWLLAMENLNNSEDAAAIAKFYQQNPQARDVLKPEWRQLKRGINEACGAEIDGTDDPDHLNHVLADLYRIEDALDLDMKPLIQDIYFTLDGAGMELGEDGLAGEFAPVYYLRPDGAEEQGEVMRQLGLIRGEVDEMFSSV